MTAGVLLPSDDAAPAGVTTLDVRGRGPQRAYVFDPHRLALPCWALHAPPSALLVTLDRHFDTVPPAHPPKPGASALELDVHARTRLDVRNFDHVLAAMEAGVVSDALVVARAVPRGAHTSPSWVDGQGAAHQLVSAASVDAFSDGFGTPRASPASQEAERLLRQAQVEHLDIDLDCFTTPSDVDPTTPVPWPEGLIRDFLLPAGSEAFWDAVLGKCVALTFAREPAHVGGLVAGGRLFEAAARAVFVELLKADLP